MSYEYKFSGIVCAEHELGRLNTGLGLLLPRRYFLALNCSTQEISFCTECGSTSVEWPTGKTVEENCLKCGHKQCISLVEDEHVVVVPHIAF
jgi:hypothetical protein